MASIKEVKAIVKLMRANGVMSYKDNGLELLLTPDALIPAKRNTKQKSSELKGQLDSLSPSFHGYSEEQILNWSSSDGESEFTEDAVN